jgi:hypothetical protein
MKHIQIEKAPKDGTPIHAFWHNGCGWESEVVWWSGDVTYPWAARHNDYPPDKFDYFQYISYPKGWDEHDPR